MNVVATSRSACENWGASSGGGRRFSMGPANTAPKDSGASVRGAANSQEDRSTDWSSWRVLASFVASETKGAE